MGNIFGSKPKPVQPQEPTPMPDPELSGAEAAARARRDVLARAGRSSTILTAPKKTRQESGGGYDSFSSPTLGS